MPRLNPAPINFSYPTILNLSSTFREENLLGTQRYPPPSIESNQRRRVSNILQIARRLFPWISQEIIIEDEKKRQKQIRKSQGKNHQASMASTIDNGPSDKKENYFTVSV
jgi:hypothetical protein